MNQSNLPGLAPEHCRRSSVFNPKEFKIQALRECPTPVEMQLCHTPERAAAYWRSHIVSSRYFDPEAECLVTLLLNTRRRIKGHHLVSIGTMDSLLVSPTSVFRVAVIASAAAIVIMHGHPSGDPAPSDADIKVTRDLVRAGQLLKIEVVDHVILGRPSPERTRDFVSLRELGYCV